MRMPARFNKLGRRRDIDRLIDAASYEELEYDEVNGVIDLGAPRRAAALEALAEIGDEEAMEAITQRLEDPDPAVRHTAVRVLAAAAPQHASEALIHGVVSWPEPYGEARLEALRALKQLDDAAIAERVVQAAASSNGSAVMDGTTRSAVVNLVADPAGGKEPREVVQLLIDMLRRADGNRTNLEIMLAWLGDHSIDILVDALDDAEICESAATVLGALRESRALPGLVRCLEDDRVDVRLASARALAEIRDVRAVEGLIHAVSDPDFEVRRQAQEALDALGTVGVVAGVTAVMQMMNQDVSRQELPKPDAI
jgi:HEAT repeat protein